MKSKKPSVKSIKRWSRKSQAAKGKVIAQMDKAHDGDTKKPEPPQVDTRPASEVLADRANTQSASTGAVQSWRLNVAWSLSDKAQDELLLRLWMAESDDWRWLAAVLSMMLQATEDKQAVMLTTHPDMKAALVRLRESCAASAKVKRYGGGMALAG